MFSFTCEKCGKRLKAQTDAVGKQATCPKCGCVFPVPDAEPPGVEPPILLDECEPGSIPPEPVVAEEPMRTSRRVDNTWAWALVLVPVVGAIVETYVSYSLLLLPLALNALFVYLDERRLKDAGYNPPTWLKAAGYNLPTWLLASFLVPVYLWKRATVLKQKKLHFWWWIGSFVVAVVITFHMDSTDIERAARPVVTKIIRDQLGGEAKCVRVEITRDLGDGYYKATAILDNGYKFPIMIQHTWRNVYVTIPLL